MREVERFLTFYRVGGFCGWFLNFRKEFFHALNLSYFKVEMKSSFIEFKLMLTVLIVCSDRRAAITLGDFIEKNNCEVDYAIDELEGLRLAECNFYDAIILDLEIKRVGGLDVCRRFRLNTRKTLSIMVVSERCAIADRCAGFEAGADDYIVKPFSPLEIMARLTAMVKRDRRQVVEKRIIVGDLMVDPGHRIAERAGKSLTFSPFQFDVLSILMHASPAFVSRENVERALWWGKYPRSDPLRVHIYNLRRIIDKPFARPLVQTVTSFGYRIAVSDE